MIDIDEFLLPLKNKNLPECLQQHFSHASAVYVCWRNFGTGGVYIPPGEPILFRLIACSFPNHPDNNIGKSIVRPEHVRLEVDVWYPHHFLLKEGCTYLNGDGKKMLIDGLNVKTDAKHHDKYICINHYVLRDEGFYQNRRLAKAKNNNGNLLLLLEHYNSFSMVKNRRIGDFIKKYYPEKYEQFWKHYDYTQ